MGGCMFLTKKKNLPVDRLVVFFWYRVYQQKSVMDYDSSMSDSMSESMSDSSRSRAASPNSQDSFVSSDGDFGEEIAGEVDLHKAYFSLAPYPGEAPSTSGGHANMRKQETAYCHRPATHNTLAPHTHNSFCYDARDQHGIASDDREVVGYYYDESGKAVAEIVENRPPPPDKNYSHMTTRDNHHLQRALGYDPDPARYRPKKETAGITNPADGINGDAQLSASRIEENTEYQSRSTFFNRTHTQQAAEMDVSRDGYDGLNPARSGPQRVRTELEHSWRETLVSPQAPKLAASQRGGDDAVHAACSARRTEVGRPFERTPGGAIQLNSVKNLPLTSEPLRKDVASVRTSGPTGGPSGATVHGGLDGLFGSRQVEHSTPGAATGATQSPLYETSGQREGGEDEELSRIETAHAAVVAHAAHAQQQQREGKEEVEARRPHDAVGRGDVAAPASNGGLCTLRADVEERKHAPHTSAAVDGRRVEALHRADAPDARKVDEVRGHNASFGAAVPAVNGDGLAPRRVSQEGESAPVRAALSIGGSAPFRVLDRIPIDPETAWVFSNGMGTSRARLESSHEIDEDRACEIDRTAGGGGEAQGRSGMAAPLRAIGGAVLGPDRLIQSHRDDWRQREKIVTAASKERREGDRCTPTRALGSAEPPLNNTRSIPTVSFHSNSSRTTPVPLPPASAAAMRG